MTTDAPRSAPAQAEFLNSLTMACGEFGVSLTPQQTEAMWRHFCLMVEANRRVNLTRITAPDQAAVKHYADSLALPPWADRTLPSAVRMLDVGTGAGLPAVPIAICRSQWEILAVDRTRKKTDFVFAAAAALGLTNLTVRHARARELVGGTEPFDLVTCRAVGDALDCLAEARRLVAVGGYFVCYATPRTLVDLVPRHNRRIARLGFGPVEGYDYRLLLGEQHIDRVLAVWRRT
jgi:16S rRNA (guanine527-N7)-methyltransferase